MIILVEDRDLLTLALQVREALIQRRDAQSVPSATAIAQAVERLLRNRVEALSTDPDTWLWEDQDRWELEHAAWEQQALCDHEEHAEQTARVA